VLSAFVKELGAHKPFEVPPLAEEPSRPAPRSSSGVGAIAPPAAPLPAEAPTAIAPVEQPSHVAAVLTSPGEAYRPPVSRGPVWIAGAAVIALAAVALGARFVGGSPPPAAPATAVATSAPPPATSSAPPPAETAASSAAPIASASAAPRASAKPAATAAPRVPRPGGATDWRPQGL
jgi:hypothetical protein